MLTVFTLHALAARQEARRDRENEQRRADGFVDVCGVAEIPEKRAVMTCLSGERVAVFRYDGMVSAISNVCQHSERPARRRPDRQRLCRVSVARIRVRARHRRVAATVYREGADV